jgi:drug/metabolite transporter (DMT)-like permease
MTTLALLATAAAGILGYSFITLAMRTGQISVVTPFRYSRQLFAIIFGFVLFGEWPDLLTWTGILIILLCGVYTARAGRIDRPNP